jgi:hypothetical protein
MLTTSVVFDEPLPYDDSPPASPVGGLSDCPPRLCRRLCRRAAVLMNASALPVGLGLGLGRLACLGAPIGLRGLVRLIGLVRLRALTHLAQQLLLLVAGRPAVCSTGRGGALLVGARHLLSLSAYAEEVVALGHGFSIVVRSDPEDVWCGQPRRALMRRCWKYGMRGR